MRRHYHSRQNYNLNWIEAITLIISIGFGPIGIGIWLLFKFLSDKFGNGVFAVAVVFMIVCKAIIDL